MPKLIKNVTQPEVSTYSLELTGEDITTLAKILGSRTDVDEEELGLDPGVVYNIYDALTEAPSPFRPHDD